MDRKLTELLEPHSWLSLNIGKLSFAVQSLFVVLVTYEDLGPVRYVCLSKCGYRVVLFVHDVFATAKHVSTNHQIQQTTKPFQWLEEKNTKKIGNEITQWCK